MEGNISWSELLKNTNVTAQHANDGNRIAATTESLKQTAHQFVTVLNERTRLFANSAQFYAAFRDAAAIRALLPGAGLGYLCTGDVYCQQGRYAAAVAIYDQGLQAVSDSDPYYPQLKQQRMTAATNNNKRVDLISRLPLDIVITNILPRMMPDYLKSELLYEPLYISRTWRERILQQPNGLRFSFGRKVRTFTNGHAELIRFAPYVQSLCGFLRDLRLDDLFSRAHFSNLKELDIISALTARCLPLTHGLQMIGFSLTCLSLFNGPYLQLRDILEACPNIQVLDAGNVDVVMSLSSLSNYPTLKHLSLWYQPDLACSHENMVDALARFPSLRILEITPMPDSTLLPLLHVHWPYLQAFFYDILSSHCGVTLATVHPNQKGIASAYLGGRAYFYKQDDLLRFLHLQRDSLETLDLRGKIKVNDDALWTISNGRVRLRDQHHQQQPPDNNPSESSFPRLTDLHFTSTYASTTHVQILLWILLNAPNLNAIHLHYSYFRPDIVDALMNLKHVQNIEITTISDDENDIRPDVISNHGIQQFLQHHIALGASSTLEHVVVEMANMEISGTRWIHLLSRLTRLKNLELLARVISYRCIPFMEEIGQGCPALEKLTVGAHGAEELADGLLMPLRKHPNLKYLNVGAHPLSNPTLMALCTFRNIKQLDLQRSIPNDFREILEEHIPKVNIDRHKDTACL